MTMFAIIIFSVFIKVSDSASSTNFDYWEWDTAQWEDELFGTGQFQFKDKKEDSTSKHLSSSTEDLMILFEAEKTLIQSLKSNLSLLNQEDLVNAYLKSIDYDESKQDFNYVYHPINAFHLLQRTTKYLPKLKKLGIEFPLNLPSASDANIGASNGIADLQEYHAIPPKDLIAGKLINYQSGTTYLSNSKLTSNEALKIANAAREAKYLSSYVGWCKAALERAKEEKKDKKFIASIKKLIQKGKEHHDEKYLSLNFSVPLGELTHVQDEPFNPSVVTVENQLKFLEMKSLYTSRFDNLLTIDPTQFQTNDLPNRMTLFFRERTQKLCRGEFQRPAFITKNLNCIWLHHQDPYLKLGPFKLEYRHRDPEIALIRDLASPEELSRIKQKARGHMKSTPYVSGVKENAYSKLRTSKVMYMNEKYEDLVSKLSLKISLATRYNLKIGKYDSENYQVMNYGIGGRISGHLDSMGGNREYSSENDKYGGIRITTFMVYLSTVESGGHTVFPQAGVYVKPVEGDALFWFNYSAHGTYDSRIYHLGCPVIYGNKWIANKWIKHLGQMQNYPCWIRQKHFRTSELQ